MCLFEQKYLFYIQNVIHVYAKNYFMFQMSSHVELRYIHFHLSKRLFPELLYICIESKHFLDFFLPNTVVQYKCRMVIVMSAQNCIRCITFSCHTVFFTLRDCKTCIICKEIACENLCFFQCALLCLRRIVTSSSYKSFFYLIVMCLSKAHEAPYFPLLYRGTFIILIFSELVVGDVSISILPLSSSAWTGMSISHAIGSLNVTSMLLLEGMSMSQRILISMILAFILDRMYEMYAVTYGVLKTAYASTFTSFPFTCSLLYTT